MPSELTEENWKDADVLIDKFGEFAVKCLCSENGDYVKQRSQQYVTMSKRDFARTPAIYIQIGIFGHHPSLE